MTLEGTSVKHRAASMVASVPGGYTDWDIHLEATDLDVDVNGGPVDAAMRYGAGRYRNALAEPNATVTRVCGQAYLDSVAGLAAPMGLARCFTKIACWRTGSNGLRLPASVGTASAARLAATAAWLWTMPIAVRV